MIDITEQMCSLADSLPSLKGRVYRTWPQKRLKNSAYAVIALIGRMVEAVDTDGAELFTRLTYSVTVCTPTQTEMDSIAGALVDLYGVYNLRTQTAGPVYSMETGTYRQVLTVSGSVDKRGNVFL